MIQYGVANLNISNEPVAKWIESNISLAEIFEFEGHSHPSDSFITLVDRKVEDPRLNMVKLERLHWPRHASRWAHAHFLMDYQGTQQIKGNVYTPGFNPPPQTLLMQGNQTITAQMFMLPARPLIEAPQGGLFLISLVDQRYYWWYKPVQIDVDGVTTSWDTLISSIGTALGVTIVSDRAVPGAYVNPPAFLSSRYEYLPPLLDAVALSLGCVVVAQLDGTIRLESPTYSLAIQTQNQNGAFPRLSGGSFST